MMPASRRKAEWLYDGRAHAEAEVKVEISRSEYARLQRRLAKLGFAPLAPQQITDYYLSRRRSRSGGWDFVRLRHVEGRGWWLTRKTWVGTADGGWVREEREERVLRARGLQMAEAVPERNVLRKTRLNFRGVAEGLRATASLDGVHLGENRRYFLECEVRALAAAYAETRANIRRWQKVSLHLSDRPEAPSMLELLLAHRPTKESRPPDC